MSNIEVKLKSGATLMVTVAPFVDAKHFQNEVLKAINDGEGLGQKEVSAIIMAAASSGAVEQAFFKCAERAVYKGDGTEESSQRVDRQLFDDPKWGEKARGDYYEIFYHVAEANIKPFILALFSVLGKVSAAGMSASQALK